MNIYIDKIYNKNKGSELMLYAILQELERKYPYSNVILPMHGLPEGVSYLQTTMNCSQRKLMVIGKIFVKIKGPVILRRILGIPFVYDTDRYPVKGLDLILDAGGYQFSDQWLNSKMDIRIKNNYYKKLKKYGTKILFLPQAFGPFETNNGKEQVNLLKHADVLIARDEISYNNLLNTGIEKDKILQYPDFTALVKGIFPEKYGHIKNGIAIIPNIKMIKKGSVSKNVYIEMLIKIINICNSSGKTIFFLNHEGENDYNLCLEINNLLNEKLPIVSGLNALETKGLISQCYFVFSSRFHGLVSALSTGVPCMATSWNHKYKMLFDDYSMGESIFNPENTDYFYDKLEKMLETSHNEELRKQLISKTETIKYKNREMWEKVWAVSGNFE